MPPLRKSLEYILKYTIYVVVGYFTVPFFLKVCIGIYDNYILTSISFNSDTIFINWNTSFPAVTVCEIYNGEKIWDISEEYFGAQHDLQIDDFVGEIVYFRGTCTTCNLCEDLACPSNFTELLQVFRSKCTQLITNCTYTNQNFNCCDEFQPIQTEYGICYVFNSNQASKTLKSQYVNNRVTGAGHLHFQALTDIQLHVHPPSEVPFLYAEGMIRETVLQGTFKEIILSVMEVHNHVSVKRLTVEQRRCRFGGDRTKWGRQLGIHEFYSFSACNVECKLLINLKYCNCTSHILVPPEQPKDVPIPICDYRGLICLTSHYQTILAERKSCDCMSSCDEPEYNIIYNSADDYTAAQPNYTVETELKYSDVTRVKISLIELPTERFVRLVTKTNLDLIISVGGIVGLFFNASLLRVVEIIFQLGDIKLNIILHRRPK